MRWTRKVIIQLDNAKPHTKKSIRQALESAARNKRGETGIEIEFAPQPAQSPDTNLDDLGFYSSLERHFGPCRNFDIGSLVRQVKEAFDSYPSEKLEKLVQTKKSIVHEIFKSGGRNDFPLPHS